MKITIVSAGMLAQFFFSDISSLKLNKKDKKLLLELFLYLYDDIIKNLVNLEQR